MTFTGSYERHIDPKGRLQIPSQVRDLLQSAGRSSVLYITPGARPGTVTLYSEDEFEALAQGVERGFIQDDKALTFQQIFYSMASRLEMDKQGRVILPERTLQRSGIGKDVVLTGVGNRLDLWDKAVYEEFMEQNWNRWPEVQEQARSSSIAASRKTPDNGLN